MEKHHILADEKAATHEIKTMAKWLAGLFILVILVAVMISYLSPSNSRNPNTTITPTTTSSNHIPVFISVQILNETQVCTCRTYKINGTYLT